jgi:hypothetical protein
MRPKNEKLMAPPKAPMSKAIRDLGLWQRAQAKAAQRAGIAHAKGGAENPYCGRKPGTREQSEVDRNMLVLSTPNGGVD